MLKRISLVERLDTSWGKFIAEIYCEPYTDVLYLKAAEDGSGFTVMLDPETGLPLTKKVWEAKYHKE